MPRHRLVEILVPAIALAAACSNAPTAGDDVPAACGDAGAAPEGDATWQCRDGSWVCAPSCAERECGPDGCDGICGICEPGNECSNGKCRPATTWKVIAGGDGDDMGLALAADAKGNVYAAGSFASAWLDFQYDSVSKVENQYMGMFVVKFDAGGQEIWAEGIGDAYCTLDAHSLSVTAAGEVTLAGATEGHDSHAVSAGPLVVHLGPDGKQAWSAAAQGAGAFAATAANAEGGVYVAGYWSGPGSDFAGQPVASPGDPEQSALALARLDAGGTQAWFKLFPASAADVGFCREPWQGPELLGGVDMACDCRLLAAARSDGGVMLAGSYERDFGGHAPDFGAGPVAAESGALADIFLARLDAEGQLVWAKAFGGAGWDSAQGLALDGQGNVFLAALAAGESIDFGGGPLTIEQHGDIVLARFDAEGNHVWSKVFGGSGPDAPRGLAVDPASGDLTVTGLFFSPAINFGGGFFENPPESNDQYQYSEAFVARFDSAGKHRWSKMLYGMLTDVGEAVAFDPGGSVYIIGWFTGKTITIFGAASEKTSTGGTSDADLFVAKLGP